MIDRSLGSNSPVYLLLSCLLYFRFTELLVLLPSFLVLRLPAYPRRKFRFKPSFGPGKPFRVCRSASIPSTLLA